ncbi:aminomethyltransferase related to GcvT [Pyrenophora tritici-repentis]|uniref:Iron-sulfur cluster assembly factor IBA57 homolog, mitochondrial n=1 Tax=Pyrenophora tritici-repentis TaxID=45151 RepID=A0A2W1D7W9_9PLEO|nr:Aminomethyltransferase folate-binding domain-containing protein [Pyrenophora tritici-repentis]KAF7449095.1 Aminomethyltransferase folate-binding domain-containing protein [Pyrenophora tritici-repentis]KAF7570902.1 aminomethyltransferase related to GcvT [Pyrenophora tritici-repentis]KAG9383965.1 Aminomethyltransferase folate-binding domain-containing protein [Pyrenophora tritici-repentis]KAI0573954.1 Aminomethyltransferase folate-binding domain-containing protein [Pyrenophora tritici-repentis
MAALPFSAPLRTPKYICGTCRTRLRSFRTPAIVTHQTFSSASSSNRQIIHRPTSQQHLRKRVDTHPAKNGSLYRFPRTREYSTTGPAPLPVTSGFAPLPHRRLISLSGPDAAKFLQGLITNNVDLNQPKPFYAAFLNAQGRVLWDVFVWVWPELLAEEKQWTCYIEVDEREAEELKKHLKRHKLRSKVEIEDISGDEVCVWAAWGSAADARVNANDTMVDMQDPRAPNFHRYLAYADVKALVPGTEPLSVTEYQIERYRYGIAEGPDEIPREDALPMEYNFDLWHGIDFKKGCYVGQELTIRTKHTGVVRKRVLPITLQLHPLAEPVEKIIVESGSEIKTIDDTQIGLKRGRARGKFIANVGDVGLALCRLEQMTSMVIDGSVHARTPEMRFACYTHDRDVVEVQPVLHDWFLEREKELWDKYGLRGL